MTGLELLQQVRSTYPDMPFIMLTGKTDLETVKVAHEFGVNAYVAKPYAPQQLEQKLVAVVEGL